MQDVATEGAGPAPGFQNHPDHEVRLEPGRSVIVTFGDEVVARSDRAIALYESRYPVRYYIPISDVADGVLTETDHSTYCPFKGTARYWSLKAGNASGENLVWGYDTPYDECAPLVGHVAFYDEKMDRVEAG